jgi:hypothetical protein
MIAKKWFSSFATAASAMLLRERGLSEIDAEFE